MEKWKHSNAAGGGSYKLQQPLWRALSTLLAYYKPLILVRHLFTIIFVILISKHKQHSIF